MTSHQEVAPFGNNLASASASPSLTLRPPFPLRFSERFSLALNHPLWHLGLFEARRTDSRKALVPEPYCAYPNQACSVVTNERFALAAIKTPPTGGTESRLMEPSSHPADSNTTMTTRTTRDSFAYTREPRNDFVAESSTMQGRCK